MSDTIQYGTAIMGVMGAVLTVFGMLRPKLLAPSSVEAAWQGVARAPIMRIPAEAVQSFIEAAGTASEATASGTRQLPIVVTIAITVLISSHFFLRIELGSAEAASRLAPIATATGIGVVVLFLNKLFSKSLYQLIERVRVERSYNYQQRRLGEFERRSQALEDYVEGPNYDESDAKLVESERAYIRRRLNGIGLRLRELDAVRQRLGPIEDLAKVGRAATFRVFVATTIVVVMLLNVAWSNLFPFASNLFELPIGDALRTIVLLIPMLLYIFVFLQTLVPATQILASGDSPESGSGDDPLHQGAVFLFLLGLSLSLALTFSALALGHLIAPEAPLPQTAQLVISNAFFDGVTLMATIRILQFATKNAVHARDFGSQFILTLKVVTAIIVDLVIAALFAVLSLYVGLVGTSLELDVLETLRVLGGLAPDGARVEFGPYFWVMHTAFIPTAIYLAVLMLLIVMKMVGVFFIKLLRGRLGAAIPSTGMLLLTLAALSGYLADIAGLHQFF